MWCGWVGGCFAPCVALVLDLLRKLAEGKLVLHNAVWWLIVGAIYRKEGDMTTVNFERVICKLPGLWAFLRSISISIDIDIDGVPSVFVSVPQ